ncbi:hypothetical protein XELAEV_18006736mg [Xenopus laevis]|uniref:Uncharacterized protein n=1 Tax=Xenopus laevis TaxID=8355 RepID=A0A974E1M2_XENLA|nr:hypothetical protein XELAEV_18006736mg [Xenopus laevis]
MKRHPVNSGIPGNYPAVRRFIRRRKPPRVLLWSICGVTCFLFLGAAVLLGVGYLNPFGTVGLVILGIGAVLFFGTILFLVMICLWVERKYPGVQTISFKIPSRRPPGRKTAYVNVNPNVSGVSSSESSRTGYTVQTDVPPYTINVPRKVSFPSVPEEQAIIEDADNNMHNPFSTPDSVLDGTVNQGKILEDNVTDSSPQTNESSVSTVMEGKTHPFQEHTDKAKKQNKKTHHVEVPFEDYPKSASSEPFSHNRKKLLPNIEEPKQLDKGTSALPNVLSDTRSECDSDSNRAKRNAPLLMEPEPGGSPKKHGPDSTDKVITASLHTQKLAPSNKNEKQVLPPNTNSPPTPNSACQQEQVSANSGKSSSPHKDQKHTRKSPAKQSKHLLVNQILNKPETFSGKAHVTLPVHSKDTAPKTETSNSSSNKKEESLQKQDNWKEHQSQISSKAVVSVIKSPRNNEDHSLQTSTEKVHHVSDPSSATVSSDVKMSKSTEKVIKNRGLSQSEKPAASPTKIKDVSHKNHGQNPQQKSSSQSGESASLSKFSPAGAKKQQANRKQQTQHKTQFETIPPRDYPSDSESSTNRKLHRQQEIQQTDDRRRSSQSREPSPAISRTFSDHKSNSENRTIKKESDKKESKV